MFTSLKQKSSQVSEPLIGHDEAVEGGSHVDKHEHNLSHSHEQNRLHSHSQSHSPIKHHSKDDADLSLTTNILDSYFWKSENRYPGPQTVNIPDVDRLKDINLFHIQSQLQKIDKTQSKVQQQSYYSYEMYKNECSLIKHDYEADPILDQTNKKTDSGTVNTMKQLQELGAVHEDRDALTMMFKSQTGALEQYLPQLKVDLDEYAVDKDVVFFNNNIHLLEGYDVNAVHEFKYESKVNIQQIDATKFVDYQDIGYQKDKVKMHDHSNLTLLEFTYDNTSDFDQFKTKFTKVFQTNQADNGQLFPFVVDRRYLYFWKTERHLKFVKPQTPKGYSPPRGPQYNFNKLTPENKNAISFDFQMSAQNSRSKTPKIIKIDPQDTALKTKGNETKFRLFKIDLLAELSEPIEIRDRAFKMIDQNGMMAVSIGFIRNPLESTYYKHNVAQGLIDEVYFLHEQFIAIKQVPINTDDLQLINMDLTVRNLQNIDEQLYRKEVNIFDSLHIFNIHTEELHEKEEDFQVQRGKTSVQTSQKQIKTQQQVSQMLAALRQRIKESLRMLDFRLDRKQSMIFITNNQIQNILDIKKIKEDQDLDSSKVQKIKIYLKKRDPLSINLQEELLNKMMNNCFITLYDMEKHLYYFKRCEPIIYSQTKYLMIKNSIFNKIITFSEKEKQIEHTSIVLKNYGLFFQNLPIKKLLNDFQNFREKWLPRFNFSNDIADFFKTLHQSDQFKQLIISKNYNNMARLEDKVLLWVKDPTTQEKVVVRIKDPDNIIDQVSPLHLSYITNRRIKKLREQRQNAGLQDLVVLTLLPEERTNNPHQDWTGKLTLQLDALEPYKTFNRLDDSILQGHAHGHEHSHGHGHSHNHKKHSHYQTPSNQREKENDHEEFYESERNVRFFKDNDGIIQILEGDNMKQAGVRSEKMIAQYLSELLNNPANEDSSINYSNTDLNYSTFKQQNQLANFQFGPRKTTTKKLKVSWNFTYEKIRFAEDDRTDRPMVVCRMVKNERQKLLQINYWLVVFDFAEQNILQQEPLLFPELDLKYEPHSVCISASSEPIRILDVRLDDRTQDYKGQKKSIYFSQNFQISFSLEHQRRVKICEFRIEWGETRVDEIELSHFFINEVEIHYIGLKELILRKSTPGRIEDIFDPELLPLLDEYNNICGTQLIFPKDHNHMHFYFKNDIEQDQKIVADNQLCDKAGYMLYRSNSSFELEAVMAFSQIKLFLFKDRKTTQLTSKDTIHILEQSVKIILNSVVLDPMLPIFRSKAIPFFLEYSLGLGFESLQWFSPISVRGIQQELEMIFPREIHGQFRKFNECCSIQEREQAYCFTSLIQRVMLDDFHKLAKVEGMLEDERCEMNFNRMETLVKDRLLFMQHDLIQLDIYFKSSVHYLLDLDQEIDFLLEKVFLSFQKGEKLPESEQIFKSMLFKFLQRDEPLKLFHLKFMATDPIVHELIKSVKNDEIGQTMKFAQKLRGKKIPTKQNVPLQIFTGNIPVALDNFSPESIVTRQLEQEELETGIEYEVETYFIDLRLPFLDNKIDWTINKMIDPEYAEDLVHCFTQYDLAMTVNDIIQNKAVNFDEEYLIKNLIDYQWENTVWWQKIFFWMYVNFYLLPFFIQIFQEDPRIVIVCNISCMLTIMWLCFYEYLQYLAADSFADYIEDFWNKNDMAHVITYGVLYFWLRITRPDDAIINFYEFEKTVRPWEDGYTQRYAVKCVLTTTNITLCAQVVMKMLNYLRIFEKFGLFILLIGQCLADLTFFLLFMFLWLIVFTVMLYILGAGVPNPEDYPHCGPFLTLMLQVWRNSLGDIQPPEYETYIQKYAQMEEYKNVHGYYAASRTPVNVLISIIWFVWLLNTIFNQIIMLNFMISIIQASYDKVINQQNQMMYAYKADLNIEVQIFKSYFQQWVGEPAKFNSVVILTAGNNEENENDSLDFIHMVRGLIQKIINAESTLQDQSNAKMQELQEIQSEMTQFMESTEKSNNEFIKSEMDAINIQLDSLTKQVGQMADEVNYVMNQSFSILQGEEMSENGMDKPILEKQLSAPVQNIQNKFSQIFKSSFSKK